MPKLKSWQTSKTTIPAIPKYQKKEKQTQKLGNIITSDIIKKLS